MTFNIWIQDKKGQDFNTQIHAKGINDAIKTSKKMTKFRGWKILDVRPIF